VDQVLTEASTPSQTIDRVFLTGGKAFVFVVRRLFEQSGNSPAAANSYRWQKAWH
jgi:hypothetical protein